MLKQTKFIILSSAFAKYFLWLSPWIDLSSICLCSQFELYSVWESPSVWGQLSRLLMSNKEALKDEKFNYPSMKTVPFSSFVCQGTNVCAIAKKDLFPCPKTWNNKYITPFFTHQKYHYSRWNLASKTLVEHWGFGCDLNRIRSKSK